jgi:hypothetical protein
MSRGRPPDLPLDPANAGPAYQAVANIDDRGRIQLPLKIVTLMEWVSRIRACDALVVLDDPGRITLHPWANFGEQVVRRRLELIERAKIESAALEPLRALEDRYKRIRIPSGSRPTLSAEMILHLGMPLDTPSSIYMWAIAQVIELNSIAHRTKGLARDWEELADLP